MSVSEVWGRVYAALFVASVFILRPFALILTVGLILMFPWVGVGIFCLYALHLILGIYMAPKADGTRGQVVFVSTLIGGLGAIASLILTGISFLIH